ncbi:MAG TPA: potassium/proton antiporter [Acetobacteraceae bacterium]|nr:potassium/proton antiporter [Acetobacteraceae bacterium]
MPIGPDLFALGRAHMEAANATILVGAALGVFSVLAGVLSRRLGAPVLLVFLVLGMLAGEDGPGGIAYDDFASAYLVGSVALAVILFEGGLKTPLSMLRLAIWPALGLAVIGVGITATIVAAAVAWIAAVPFAMAMLVGAAVAPTDAAAVATLLARARLALPERITALLEVESGLNDPMSIFLTVFVIHVIVQPVWATWLNGALLFAREMLGGTAIGLGGGWLLALLLRRLSLEVPTAMVLVLAFGLALFGLAQVLGTSGFLAIYLAGVLIGASPHPARREIGNFVEGCAWLAQIVLFLMLGMLVTPFRLVQFIPIGIVIAVVLIVVARPVATFACLLPFRFPWRESAFASWVGLRGAVPIYISFIPALADPTRDERLFSGVFVVVVVSLVIQGWTIGPAARLLGFSRSD